jgi:hypothetical protein
MKSYEPSVTDERGDEHHPAFAMARVNRVHSHPGAVLFESDLHHATYMTFTVSTAIRNAELNVDYAAQQLAEHAEEVVEKSRADIEAMVASAEHRLAAEGGIVPPGITSGSQSPVGGNESELGR